VGVLKAMWYPVRTLSEACFDYTKAIREPEYMSELSQLKTLIQIETAGVKKKKRRTFTALQHKSEH
jgi:hypothetical protein